jgi:FkbM family methyltransferase
MRHNFQREPVNIWQYGLVTILNIREKFFGRLLIPGSQASYSQFGEDLIINHLFHDLGIVRPTYLDIGANHPRFISNTYYFYQRGSSGVLIEPNPRLSKRLSMARPRDIVLQVGIGLRAQSEADFFVFPSYADGLSTFSKAEAAHWETVGMKGFGKIPVEAVIRVPLMAVNDVIASHFGGRGPNFLSLDVEGLDLEVLQSLDFAKFSPDVICVETLAYDENQNGYKRGDIIDFATARGYFAYADTRVNTIFVKSQVVPSKE